MTRPAAQLRLSLAALLGLACAVWLAPLQAQAPADFPSRVDAIFAAWDSIATPGCAVGVSDGGRIVLERAYGMADLEHLVANRADTIFEAGSVSKQFTAAAVLLLAGEGRLSLDDQARTCTCRSCPTTAPRSPSATCCSTRAACATGATSPTWRAGRGRRACTRTRTCSTS